MAGYFHNNNENRTIYIEFPGAAFYKEPWREATQEEIDGYLLGQAKSTKISALKSDLSAFVTQGYEYSGTIVLPAWSDATTYSNGEVVCGSDSNNYTSIADDNLNHDPVSSPKYWELFKPVFKITDCAILNIDAHKLLSDADPNKHKFFDSCNSTSPRHEIDFGDAAGWNAFAETITTEQNRVMRKYNQYRIDISLCKTVAQVEAITIDFSA